MIQASPQAPGDDPARLWGDAAWDWPDQLPALMLQRMVDVQAILALERAPADLLSQYHGRVLGELMQHVMSASPWWRARLAPHMPPAGGIVSLSDLPQLTRAELAQQVATEGALPLPAFHGAVRMRSTSGSTGQPLAFHESEFTQRMVEHHYEADHERQGRDRCMLRAAINTRVDPHPGRPHHELRARPWQGDGVELARHWRHGSPREHAQWLAEVSPGLLSTAPVMLDAMLHEYEADPTLRRPRISQVMTYSETVSADLRARVRQILGADLRDRYSCEEAGPIAFQCPRDESRHHVAIGNVIVEVVDDAGRACAAGEPGHVLITALHQWATPMIRYAIGDMAALHMGCGCGVHGPVLGQLLGRRMALLRSASGRLHHVFIRARQWLAIAPVQQHLVRQTAIDTLQVEIVAAPALSDAQLRAIEDLVARATDHEFTVTARQVSVIAPAPGFKRRDVIGLA